MLRAFIVSCFAVMPFSSIVWAQLETGSEHLLGTALHRDVERYVEFGDHRTATSVDLKTADWLMTELQSAGLKTEKMPFVVPQFFIEKVALEIDGKDVEAFPFWPVKATGPNAMVGKLVDTRKDPTVDVKGKIAVMKFDVSSLRADLGGAIQAMDDRGAIGGIFVCETASGDLFGFGTPKTYPIPVLMVGDNDQVLVTEAAGRGSNASIVIDGRAEAEAKAFEIVGKLERGEKLIVVSTPYSAWFESGGERGPGVSMWLGLAKWAAARKSDCSYLFVASSGHEYDGVGAKKFLEEHAPEISKVSCWLHLGASIAAYDWERTPAGMNKLNHRYTRTRLSTNRPELLTLMKEAFDPLGGWQPQQANLDPGELGLIFAAGYPAFGFSGGHPFFHSPRDTAECTGPELLEPVAKALAEILLAIEKK